MRRSGQKIDLTGQRFGRWTVIEQAPPGEGYSTRWLCECDCGTIKTVDSQLLRSGRSKSCGCLCNEMRMQSPRTLIDADLRLRAIYNSIRSACENPRNPKWEKFGAKGITVHPAWVNNYKAFEEWSIKNGYEPEAFLLRYDVRQGFTPWNCKWTRNKDYGQGRKGEIMITANGETHSLAEWSRITGLHRSSIEERLLRGATPEQAVDPRIKPRGRKPEGKSKVDVSGDRMIIKEKIRLAGLKQYQVAEQLGIDEANFSRMLRYRLSEEQKAAIDEAINAAKAKN